MIFEAGKIVYLKNVAGEVMEGKFTEDTTPPMMNYVHVSDAQWVDFIVINRIGGKAYESPTAINMRNIVSIKPK